MLYNTNQPDRTVAESLEEGVLTYARGSRVKENDGKAEPLPDLVARSLRAEILRGEHEPGSRLSQEALAQRFGTSRIPVREALRQLITEGFLVFEQDAGVRVAQVSVQHVIEVYRMRELLEPMLLSESVHGLDSRSVDTLAKALKAGEREASSLNIPAYLEADRLFHLSSYDGANLPRVRRVVDNCWDTVEWFRRLYSFLPRRLEVASMEHRLILDAIQERRSDDAHALLEVHIRRTRHALTDHQAQVAELSRLPDLSSGRVALPPDAPRFHD
jgi:DNA-binding GntR family transcriptional regulator